MHYLITPANLYPALLHSEEHLLGVLVLISSNFMSNNTSSFCTKQPTNRFSTEKSVWNIIYIYLHLLIYFYLFCKYEVNLMLVINCI